MSGEVLAGVVVGLVLAVTGALTVWTRWSLKTAVRDAIRHEVNGKIDSLTTEVGKVVVWTGSHDRRHGHEQKQLIAALNRQGIKPPDGWKDTPE